MVQGTGSGVGKSLLVTALCRILARAGYRVAPFKSQNMALNSAVTADGREIGRAQAAQAEAAGIEPTVDMNPILLKPEADDRSQLIVLGIPVGRVTFREYAARQPALLPVVADSLARLRRSHDVVVIEGAGSPAEINLSHLELVNMRIARLADAPVLLVGDIERGGVFAALVGTLALLAADDRARVRGLVINKLRGDATLLGRGLDELRARTGVPVLGVVPYLSSVGIPAEDSLDLEDGAARGAGDAVVDVAVVRLPRIANFDEFDALAAEPGVSVRFVRRPAELAGADLLVVPGSKSTVADLGWLRTGGVAAAIARAVAEGRPVLGICGGFQMLGRSLRDPGRIESDVPETAGLGLLPVETTFASGKATLRVTARVAAASGWLRRAAGARVSAYEIHAGRTEVNGAPQPFALESRGGEAATGDDGATDARGLVVGTYLHGLFDNAGLRRAVLEALAERSGVAPDPRWGDARAQCQDALADAVAAALHLDAVAALVGVTLPKP
jgi:adenosylcobyric acid synthase